MVYLVIVFGRKMALSSVISFGSHRHPLRPPVVPLHCSSGALHHCNDARLVQPNNS